MSDDAPEPSPSPQSSLPTPPPPRAIPIRDPVLDLPENLTKLDHRPAHMPENVQLELEQVAPVGTGTKMFAAIGFAIVVVSLVIALLLPVVLIAWMLRHW